MNQSSILRPLKVRKMTDSQRRSLRVLGIVANIARLLALVWLGSFVIEEILRFGAGDRTPQQALLVLEVTSLTILVAIIAVDFILRVRSGRATKEALKNSVDKSRLITRAADSEVMTVRREVAMWVHGSVQSAVIATRSKIVAELESLVDDAGGWVDGKMHISRTRFDRVVSAAGRPLEDLSTDIRNRARELWPEHRELPIKPALEKVGGPSAVVHLTALLDWSDVDTESSGVSHDRFHFLRSSKQRLSVQSRYEVIRIVEESINNARKHGSTRESIVVNLQDNVITVEVSNNGEQLKPDRLPGLGTAVIDEIVSRRNGSWAIQNLQVGVIMKARFEVESASLNHLVEILWDDTRTDAL